MALNTGLASLFVGCVLGLQPPATPVSPGSPAAVPPSATPNPVKVQAPVDDPAVTAAETYAIVFGQAWAALEGGDAGKAKSLLESAPEGNRGWEYRHARAWAEYLTAHPGAGAENRTGWMQVGGKDSRVTVDIDPGSKWVAFGGSDAKVHVVELAGGKEIAAMPAMWEDAPPAPPKPPEKEKVSLRTVFHAAFSKDGSRLVTGAGDGTVRVFDTKTWKMVTRFREEAEYVAALAVSADATRIAVVTGGKNATLWKADGAKGYTQLATLGPAMNFGRPVAFTADGKKLAVGGKTAAEMFDAVTGEPLKGDAAKLGGGSPFSMALAFSPDGKWMASGCRGSVSKSVHLFTVADGQQVYEFLRHSKGIQGLSFSADSKRLVTASLDNTARILDAATGVELLKLDSGSPVRSAVLSADGKWLVLGTAQGVKVCGPPPADPAK